MPQPEHSSDATIAPGGETRAGTCSFRARVRAFRDAVRGIGLLVRFETHSWIHLAATISVIALAACLGLPLTHWLAIFAAIGLVWAAEAMNTAMERLCDVVQPHPDDRIARIKDIAAGGVLLASLAAAAIGAVVFVPPLIRYFAAD